jgi:recombination protein RecA
VDPAGGVGEVLGQRDGDAQAQHGQRGRLRQGAADLDHPVRVGEVAAEVLQVLDLGVDRGLIEKTGAWFEIAGERLGPGREKAAEALRANVAAAEELEGKLRELGASDKSAPSPTQAEAAA